MTVVAIRPEDRRFAKADTHCRRAAPVSKLTARVRAEPSLGNEISLQAQMGWFVGAQFGRHNREP
jgi:hypothetical protein